MTWSIGYASVDTPTSLNISQNSVDKQRPAALTIFAAKMAFSRSFHAQLLKQTFPRRPLAASSLRPTRQLLSKRCNSSATAQSQSQQSTRSRSLRNLIYIAIFGGLGLSLGSRIEKLIATPPEPDTEEDTALRRSIEDAYERLPIVQALRDDPDFGKEWNAYSNFSEEEKEHRLTSGPLKGGRGLALQVRWSFFVFFFPFLVVCLKVYFFDRERKDIYSDGEPC